MAKKEDCKHCCTKVDKLTVKIEDNAIVELSGSESAINAAAVSIGNNVKLNIACTTSRKSGAAIFSSGSVLIGNNTNISIGANEETGCGGIHADSSEGVTIGNNSSIFILIFKR